MENLTTKIESFTDIITVFYRPICSFLAQKWCHMIHQKQISKFWPEIGLKWLPGKFLVSKLYQHHILLEIDQNCHLFENDFWI